MTYTTMYAVSITTLDNRAEWENANYQNRAWLWMPSRITKVPTAPVVVRPVFLRLRGRLSETEWTFLMNGHLGAVGIGWIRHLRYKVEGSVLILLDPYLEHVDSLTRYVNEIR